MRTDPIRELVEKATPGPWHYTGLRLTENDRHWPSVGAYAFGREQGAAVVATTEPPYHEQPAVDDARLIALAPDLAVVAADLADALRLQDNLGAQHPEKRSAKRNSLAAYDALAERAKDPS